MGGNFNRCCLERGDIHLRKLTWFTGSPKHLWFVFVDVSPFPRWYFQVPAVSFRGCIFFCSNIACLVAEKITTKTGWPLLEAFKKWSSNAGWCIIVSTQIKRSTITSYTLISLWLSMIIYKLWYTVYALVEMMLQLHQIHQFCSDSQILPSSVRVFWSEFDQHNRSWLALIRLHSWEPKGTPQNATLPKK